MNTEATQDNSAVNSTGERLRGAREQMGLTQQNVAERLCLKLSTVRDIEEDKSPTDLASTFLRGYIRSYARLVHVPEEELLPMMEKQTPARAARVEPMQSLSLGKRRKKRDGWLMIFTWLVLFVVIGLTGAWWWQNHKAAQDDLVSMAAQNSETSGDKNQSIPLNENNTPDSNAADNPADNSTATQAQSTPAETSSAPAVSAPVAPTTPVVAIPAPATDAGQPVAVSPGQSSVDSSANGQMPVGAAGVSTPTVDANALVMNFDKDCWLEVTDAKGKKLFSGMQHSGGKLSLAGVAPYRLKIGAPGAVQIQYQGQPVDLSRFIRTNQVARLTVGAQ